MLPLSLEERFLRRPLRPGACSEASSRDVLLPKPCIQRRYGWVDVNIRQGLQRCACAIQTTAWMWMDEDSPRCL
jgi:hypothetical protein